MRDIPRNHRLFQQLSERRTRLEQFFTTVLSAAPKALDRRP
jgi:hypothetical protein